MPASVHLRRPTSDDIAGTTGGSLSRPRASVTCAGRTTTRRAALLRASAGCMHWAGWARKSHLKTRFLARTAPRGARWLDDILGAQCARARASLSHVSLSLFLSRSLARSLAHFLSLFLSLDLSFSLSVSLSLARSRSSTAPSPSRRIDPCGSGRCGACVQRAEGAAVRTQGRGRGGGRAPEASCSSSEHCEQEEVVDPRVRGGGAGPHPEGRAGEPLPPLRPALRSAPPIQPPLSTRSLSL